jgi:hypothetical protein
MPGNRAEDEVAETPTPTIQGIPPGVVPAVLQILATSPAPMRRRKLLEELVRAGHRISLAGLNRVLQQCQQTGLTLESEAGVRLRDPTAGKGDPPR